MVTLLRVTATAGMLVALAACGGGGGSSNDADGQAGAGQNTPAPGAGATPDTGGSVSTALAQIRIETTGGVEVTSTEDYVDATVRLIGGDGSELLAAPTEIRGRGNTTWGLPKKPYRLKLETAASLLGMPAAKNWNLLANYSDKTLIRNKLAMTLGQQAGMPYVPRSQFVEIYFNGAYQGVYQLFEHIEVGANRVNIDKLDENEDTGADRISGGYLLEVDHRLDEDVCWYTSMNIPICSKAPEFDADDVRNPAHPSYTQYNYITSYLNAAEQAINTSGNAYQEYFDTDAMVNWYLVSELMKNNDSQINGGDSGSFTSSVFLTKPRGGKLNFGPLWDFDIAAGNINYNYNDDPTGWWIRNGAWHAPLFAHSDFGRRVFDKWCQLRRDGVIGNLGTQVDQLAATINKDAVDRNFQRWPILGTYVWPNPYIGNTYQEEVDHLKSWMTQRAAWMHGEYVREFGECPAS